ncbi:hypothetical protein CAL65_16900 [Alkalilimnicola ehrlichii]|uniref:histidine kinase n=1 Tax=Alkalilimnicola ehrlichii TaxID=351052 RepID=A0A3E0WNL9_9GAMM|nr:hypothetical protein CAL65_16900 [Alkalilimnicola ehrlichii]
MAALCQSLSSTIRLRRLCRAGARSVGGKNLREALRELRAERDELQLELEVADAARRRAEDNLEHFTYVVSHDLQEPLRMVIGFSQLLEKRYAEPLDDEGREFLELTTASALRMSAMLGVVLQLSRILREPVSGTEVDLNAVIEDLREEFANQLNTADAKLEIGALPMVQGSRQLLEMALWNLLDNALKFRGKSRPESRSRRLDSARSGKLQ